MRRVLFAIYVPPCRADGSTWVNGHYTEMTNEGTFHQWGTNVLEGQNDSYAQETVAIVEDVAGRVYKVDPGKMQFIDPLTFIPLIMDAEYEDPAVDGEKEVKHG